MVVSAKAPKNSNARPEVRLFGRVEDAEYDETLTKSNRLD